MYIWVLRYIPCARRRLLFGSAVILFVFSSSLYSFHSLYGNLHSTFLNSNLSYAHGQFRVRKKNKLISFGPLNRIRMNRAIHLFSFVPRQEHHAYEENFHLPILSSLVYHNSCMCFCLVRVSIRSGIFLLSETSISETVVN